MLTLAKTLHTEAVLGTQSPYYTILPKTLATNQIDLLTILHRTDWAGRSMAFPEKQKPEYDHMKAEETMKKRNGTQAGDPLKGAKAMYKLATMEDPPLRAVIGSDAHKKILQKVDEYGENYKKYADLANSTDVDE